MPKEFCCVICGKHYETSGGLRKHYRKFPKHKSDETTRTPLTASKAVDLFLGVNQIHRRARLKELVKGVSDEETREICHVLLMMLLALMNPVVYQ